MKTRGITTANFRVFDLQKYTTVCRSLCLHTSLVPFLSSLSLSLTHTHTHTVLTPLSLESSTIFCYGPTNVFYRQQQQQQTRTITIPHTLCAPPLEKTRNERVILLRVENRGYLFYTEWDFSKPRTKKTQNKIFFASKYVPAFLPNTVGAGFSPAAMIYS